MLSYAKAFGYCYDLYLLTWPKKFKRFGYARFYCYCMCLYCMCLYSMWQNFVDLHFFESVAEFCWFENFWITFCVQVPKSTYRKPAEEQTLANAFRTNRQKAEVRIYRRAKEAEICVLWDSPLYYVCTRQWHVYPFSSVSHGRKWIHMLNAIKVLWLTGPSALYEKVLAV